MKLLSSEATLAPPAAGTVRLVMLVTAAMSFLALCALAAALASNRLASSWTSSLDGVATVRIDYVDEGLGAQVDQALALLNQTEGVSSARAYTDEELQTLLSPWLGEDTTIEALPAPRLIELKVDDDLDQDALRAKLVKIAPGATFDSHGEWRQTLRAASSGLRRMSLGALLLASVAAAAVVALAARASVATNIGVVEALCYVGAEDRFVARVFEQRFALSALGGGLIGAALAVAGLFALPATEGGGAFALDFRPKGFDWALLAAIPLISALVAWGATRVSVLAAVRRVT